jgi:NDP-sugar pyrophosphorylase family protein
MSREFTSLNEGASEQEALALMRREVLHQIPVLDPQGRVLRLHLFEDLLNARPLENWAVLMAGGLGTRLLPFTQNSPKPMLRVAGRPMLEIVLERCLEAGFQRVFISVNHLKEQIIDYFGDGSRWGASIEYLIEVNPLGTAGALALLPTAPSSPLLVANGDVLTRVDFGHLLRFHIEHKAAATICVRAHEVQIPYGVVETDGMLMRTIRDKPIFSHYINAGIYVLNPEVVSRVNPGDREDMPALLTKVSSCGSDIAVCPIHEYWLDTGNPEALAQAHGDWD